MYISSLNRNLLSNKIEINRDIRKPIMEFYDILFTLLEILIDMPLLSTYKYL